MVKVEQNLSYNPNYYEGVTNTCDYITIHETANTSNGANADMHAEFINNGSEETWHYTVDDKKAVQHYYHTTCCWHAGTDEGNYNSIGIEICVNQDGDYKKALKNAVSLVKKIKKQENISANHVVQHNFWSGKDCPMLLREGTHGMTWNEFMNRVKGKKVKSKPGKHKKVGEWYVNQYGTYYKPEEACFVVGDEPIIQRVNSPFTTAPRKNVNAQPGESIIYHTVAIQDGYAWIEYSEGTDEIFVPVRHVKGTPPDHEVGELWGEIK